MRIIHIDFSGPYTEGMTYQENLLTDAMALDGNEVYLLVPCYEWNNGKKQKTEKCKNITESGVNLQRFEFNRLWGEYASRKLRYVPSFYKTLCSISPDIIFFHCPQTLTAISVCKYVKNHPSVKMVMDNHSDYYNSATNIWSRLLLHRMIYKPIMKMVCKYSKKVYCITTEVRDFALKEYRLDERKIRILPLGGVVPDNLDYKKNRGVLRRELGLKDDEILIVNSGKINASKKTDVLIDAFYKANTRKCILIILGQLDDEMLPKINVRINDPRNHNKVRFLGWKNADELIRFLCAADVYAQPGGMSATFQNAICCRCAVISYPYKSYVDSYVDGNGIWAKNEEELVDVIKFIDTHPEELREMQKKSEEIAREKLNYVKQGRKIIQDCLG